VYAATPTTAYALAYHQKAISTIELAVAETPGRTVEQLRTNPEHTAGVSSTSAPACSTDGRLLEVAFAAAAPEA